LGLELVGLVQFKQTHVEKTVVVGDFALVAVIHVFGMLQFLHYHAGEVHAFSGFVSTEAHVALGQGGHKVSFVPLEDQACQLLCFFECKIVVFVAGIPAVV